MDISSWQDDLQHAVRDSSELLEALSLTGKNIKLADHGQKTFPVKVPNSYIDRIKSGDPDDPLLRQILPLTEEDTPVSGFESDPLGENRQQPVPGLIQKYQGRVLLVTTGACAIHCRYCFRRHYPYNDNNPGKENWQTALDFIRADTSIKEVILSGGDPLSLTDEKLETLIKLLEEIPHLKWLRLHTRMPVVLPNRVTKKLIDVLTTNRFKVTVVVHANHPDEINDEVENAFKAFHQKGIQLLNQSVLLHGINNDATVLIELSERLYQNHVLPYYLHVLDPVAGAAHFQVDEAIAVEIMETLRTNLPGYLVPCLVREQEGTPYKIPVQQ